MAVTAKPPPTIEGTWLAVPGQIVWFRAKRKPIPGDDALGTTRLALGLDTHDPPQLRQLWQCLETGKYEWRKLRIVVEFDGDLGEPQEPVDAG